MMQFAYPPDSARISTKEVRGSDDSGCTEATEVAYLKGSVAFWSVRLVGWHCKN